MERPRRFDKHRFFSMATIRLTLAQLYLKAQKELEKSLRYRRPKITIHGLLFLRRNSVFQEE